MRFQALVEIVCAYTGNDNCHDNQENSNHGEKHQRLPRREILRGTFRGVHSYELEQEICQATEVQEL